jgi:hypothetical protein
MANALHDEGFCQLRYQQLSYEMLTINNELIISTAALFLYWLISAFCGGLTLASVVANKATVTDYSFVSQCVGFSLVLAMFFLAFWSEGRPKYSSFDKGECD